MFGMMFAKRTFGVGDVNVYKLYIVCLGELCWIFEYLKLWAFASVAHDRLQCVCECAVYINERIANVRPYYSPGTCSVRPHRGVSHILCTFVCNTPANASGMLLFIMHSIVIYI